MKKILRHEKNGELYHCVMEKWELGQRREWHADLTEAGFRMQMFRQKLWEQYGVEESTLKELDETITLLVSEEVSELEEEASWAEREERG